MRYVVFTSGHSGSTWLSLVLHQPDMDTVAFHEPLSNMLGHLLAQSQLWSDCATLLSRESVLATVAPYLEWLQHRERQYEVVGEIHTGYWSFWARVPECLPAMRYLVTRNGIQVVHSLSYNLFPRNHNHQKPPGARLPEARLPHVSGDLVSEEQTFHKACRYWAGQRRLAEELQPIETWRLEDLTTDRKALEDFVRQCTGRTIPAERCVEYQATVTNRKVLGDRSPQNLYWNLWTEAQRSLFHEVCASAMAHFGYRMPERSEAPAVPDLRPLSPSQEPIVLKGPFAPLWVFTSNRSDKPILVYGRGHRALLAADLFGRSQAFLVEEQEGDWRDLPLGFRKIAIADALQLSLAGIFIADASFSEDQLSRLRGLFPNVEMVKMLPGELTEEQQTRRWESDSPRPQCLVAFGPVRVGDRVSAVWEVSMLEPRKPALELHLTSRQGVPLHLTLSPEATGRHRPFPVAEGGLYYRPCALDFHQFKNACEILATRFRAATGSSPLSVAMTEWFACAE